MKIKLISLAYIIFLSTSIFASDLFVDGSFGITPQAQLSAFNTQNMKLQPKIEAEASFNLNYLEYFKTGLSAGIVYAMASDLNGGWNYPGFSGFETGLEIRMTMPIFDVLDFGGSLDAGWYRYNLTDSMFFLPSVSLYPAIRIFEDEHTKFLIEIPVRYYFHRQADLFMSAGIRINTVIR